MDLTTKARVKELAVHGSTANDDWFDQVIAGVSAAIEAKLERYVEVASRTERFRANGIRRIFFLMGSPISSISGVTNGGSTLDTDAYRIHPEVEGAVEFLSPPSDIWDGGLEITYTGGMAADTAALIAAYPDLALAAEKEVLSLWQRKGQLAEVVSESYSGSTLAITKSMAWLPETLETIERYRLP